MKPSLSSSVALLGGGHAMLALLLVSMACGSSKSKGSLVIGLETDVSVPQNVDGIGIAVAVNGQVKYSKLFSLDQSAAGMGRRAVKLPATIAVVEPDDSSAPQVDIRAVAFHKGEARIVRDVISTVPHARTALLRMPLHYLAYNDGVTGSVPVGAFRTLPKSYNTTIHLDDTATDDAGLDADIITTIDSRCTATQHLTNVDGECVPALVDSSTLPDYLDSELFENGKDEFGESNPEACFDMEKCFSTPEVATLDRSDCSVPLTGNADDVNVAMRIKQPNGVDVGFCVGADGDGKRCMVPLDRDDAHGFRIDSARNRIVLPKGVCERTTVTGIELSHGCPSKSVLMPIDGAGANCLDDGNHGEAGTNDAASDADASMVLDAGPQVTPDILLSNATQVATPGGGDVIAITSDNTLTYYGSKNQTVGNPITNVSATKTGAAFVSLDTNVKRVYATFDDNTIAFVTYQVGTGLMGPVTKLTGLVSEKVGRGIDIFNTMWWPSDTTFGSYPSLDLRTDTAASGQLIAPYKTAFAFDTPDNNSTIYNAFGGVVDGGTGVAIVMGTPPTNYVPTPVWSSSSNTRIYGMATVGVPPSTRIVLTAAHADGLVHVFVVDATTSTLVSDLGSIGTANAADPDPFLMRNLASDGNGTVYLTDDQGNLKYVTPKGANPAMANLRDDNAVCLGSLGVATDSTSVYRACSTGVTKDPLFVPK